MNKEELESSIYAEAYLAKLYRKASSLAVREEVKELLSKYAQDEDQYVVMLNNLYRREYGSSYDPIIPSTNGVSDFRTVMDEIFREELKYAKLYRNKTYFQNDYELREVLRYISDNKYAHIISLLALFSNEILGK